MTITTLYWIYLIVSLLLLIASHVAIKANFEPTQDDEIEDYYAIACIFSVCWPFVVFVFAVVWLIKKLTK